MIIKYREMMRGETPQGCTKARAGDDSIEEKKKTGKKWDYMIKIAKAFRIVKLAKAGSVPESTKFNPMGMECRCWAGRHDGICSHVIAVNAYKKEINLEEFLLKIDAPKKRGRPKVLNYMQRQVGQWFSNLFITIIWDT